MKIALSALVISMVVLWGRCAASDSGTSRWRATALAKLESIGPDPTVEELMKIAGYLGVASRGDQMADEHREVFEKTRTKIIGLPNHGRFFGEAIERAIQDEFVQVSAPGTTLRVYPERWHVFEDLSYLSSPQVIALLGQLLEDDRDPWKGQPAPDYNLPHPNSYLAAKTLNRIGIEGGPVIEPIRDDRDFEAARDQWKLWFAQVKAGNRTFRFKGDAREYNLDGPVAVVPGVSRAERGVPSSESSSAANLPATTRLVWLPLALAILVLAAAFGCWLSSRRSARPGHNRL